MVVTKSKLYTQKEKETIGKGEAKRSDFDFQFAMTEHALTPQELEYMYFKLYFTTKNIHVVNVEKFFKIFDFQHPTELPEEEQYEDEDHVTDLNPEEV